MRAALVAVAEQPVDLDPRIRALFTGTETRILRIPRGQFRDGRVEAYGSDEEAADALRAAVPEALLFLDDRLTGGPHCADR